MGHVAVKPTKRRICFVTGTRAEFGLMRSTLNAIAAHRQLQLQIVVTGMHLDQRLGRSIDVIRDEGWKIDAVVPWNPRQALAVATGQAMADLARAYARLKSEIVLVVGDRVESFAAASAAHLSHLPLAHVHGGDRAEGQVDDSLRHAITKLAHIHFPATAKSAERIRCMGEDPWRIHRVGSPGLDGIKNVGAASAARLFTQSSVLSPQSFALLVLHPADPDDALEESRANLVLNSALSVGFPRIVVVYPNNDPGHRGIVRCWQKHKRDPRLIFYSNLPRPDFLAHLRRAAVLIGNSSSGIIEAASFHTPVIDIGPRQRGRERSDNVTAVPYRQSDIRLALQNIWNQGRPRRAKCPNVYASPHTSRKIADILARTEIDRRLLRKLIAL
jgi:GDP/UDP-N,N'-diacetylbacillosamine 2-epimerase (hydrolysing)